MALQDPIHIYDAENNNDAVLVQMFLERNGIEAFFVDDTPVFTTWMFGTLPGIYRPRIWVDRADAERARALIIEFEQQNRSRDSEQRSDTRDRISVSCEECNRTSTFPISQRGTVQDCPHCGAYVDVGDVESFEVGE